MRRQSSAFAIDGSLCAGAEFNRSCEILLCSSGACVPSISRMCSGLLSKSIVGEQAMQIPGKKWKKKLSVDKTKKKRHHAYFVNIYGV